MGALTFDVFIRDVMAEIRTSTLPAYEYTYDSAYWVIGCGECFFNLIPRDDEYAIPGSIRKVLCDI